MKKLSILLALCLLTTLLPAAVAETNLSQVSTPEELTAVLADDAVAVVEIISDMTITSVTEDASFVLTKDVTIAEGVNVLFQPAPDDGFFVKSLTIPEGVTLTVKGSLATMSTFEGGFAIAQVYLNGGTLDVSAGTVSEDCNICFNAGTLVAPAEGFGEKVSVARYLYEDVTEAAILDALSTDHLQTVDVQMDCTVTGAISIPEEKTLQISAFVTVADGGSLTGNVVIDEDCGLILLGSAAVNDVTPDEGTAGCILTWTGDAGYEKTPCDAEGNPIG